MEKEFKLTKAAKGYEESDAANMAIRNILTEISRQISKNIRKDDIEEMLNFFERKCPYTGENYDKEKFSLDHIVPMNKDKCGLNVKGNIVYALKEANAKKHKKTLKEFFESDYMSKFSKKEKEKRIKKIEQWQAYCNYNQDEISDKLHDIIGDMYKKICENQKDFTKKCLLEIKNKNH